MKILLDENLPDELKPCLKSHVVSTVEEENWRSIQNGELLNLIISSGFEVLITTDTNLCYQQNFRKYAIPVIVLRARKFNKDIVLQFATDINKLLKGRLKPGPHELTLD